jgi:hypothetical protein
MIPTKLKKIYIHIYLKLQNITQMVQEIILRNIEKPHIKNFEECLIRFCDSLGFSSARDIDKTVTKIIFSLIDKLSNDEVMSSEDLAGDLNITISRVNHHIRNLNDSGLFIGKNVCCICVGAA